MKITAFKKENGRFFRNYASDCKDGALVSIRTKAGIERLELWFEVIPESEMYTVSCIDLRVSVKNKLIRVEKLSFPEISKCSVNLAISKTEEAFTAFVEAYRAGRSLKFWLA